MDKVRYFMLRHKTDGAFFLGRNQGEVQFAPQGGKMWMFGPGVDIAKCFLTVFSRNQLSPNTVEIVEYDVEEKMRFGLQAGLGDPPAKTTTKQDEQDDNIGNQ